MRDRITYEILENGYLIKLDGKPWIKQYEPYIPYPNLSYEEGCLKHIEEIVASHEAGEKAQQEAEQEKAQLLEQIALQDEAINELASLVSELMMAQESEVQ